MTLHALLAPLYATVISIGSYEMAWAELLGFLTGAVGVWLVVRRHIANFPIGLANTAFFLLLFLDARLWADASLQVLFALLGIQGWWLWLRRGPDLAPLTVTRASTAELTAVAVAVLVITATLVPVLHATNGAAPLWDAITTGLSLGAQWLLNAKKLQNWWLWIAADTIYVPLYVSKGLLLTGACYLLFLLLCISGLRHWRRALTPAVPVDDRVPA